MTVQKAIKRDFTLLFQIRYCLTMIGCLFLFSCAFYFYFDQNLNGSYFQTLTTLDKLQSSLPLSLGLTFLLQCLVMLVMTIVINIYVSHKIAGPVYRYEHSLRALRDGDLAHVVRTRDGDQLKNMVEVMNQLFAEVRRSYVSTKVLQDELNQGIACLERGEGFDPATLRAAIAAARQQLGGVATEEGGRHENH